MMAANVFSSGYNNLFASTPKQSVFSVSPAVQQLPKGATSGYISSSGSFVSPYGQPSGGYSSFDPSKQFPSTNTNLTPGGGSVLGTTTNQTTQTPTPAPTPAPTNSNTLMDQSTANINDQLRTSGQDSAARTSEFYNQQVGKVEDAYKPMFQYLDNQIGAAQGELSALNDPNVMGGAEKYVEGMYSGTLADLTAEQQAARNALEARRAGVNTSVDLQKQGIDAQAEGQKSNIFANTAKNVSAIDAAARASMQGLNRRLGAAADSSAASVGNEALARQALKQKGEQLGLRSQLLSDLDTAVTTGKISVEQWGQGIQNEITAKQGEVDTVHQQAISKLNTWKRDALYQAANDFQARVADLEQQKAGATIEKQQQIAQLEQQEFANIENVLRDIDSKVIANTQAADQWKIQKMSSLEDLRAQYQMAAQYATPSAPDYQLKDVVTGTDANGAPIKQTMIFDPSTGQLQPYAGYQMLGAQTVDDAKRRAVNLFNGLSDTSNLGPATLSVVNS